MEGWTGIPVSELECRPPHFTPITEEQVPKNQEKQDKTESGEGKGPRVKLVEAGMPTVGCHAAAGWPEAQGSEQS